MSRRRSVWPAGVPCWADLTVSDVPAACAFYSDVLGWSFSESEPSSGDVVIARVNGAAAAAIGRSSDHAPAAWTPYIASDDLDATSRVITKNGGSILEPPAVVGSLGHGLQAADSTGGRFGVWRAGSLIGAEIVNEAGALGWEDLRSSDPKAARAFYRSVFGYAFAPLTAAGPDYELFMLPNENIPLGGMGGMSGSVGDSHWVVHFVVPNVMQAEAAAESRGGSTLVPPFDTPYGWMMQLADPVGADFWVRQASGSIWPDRSG